ncbi:Cyclin, C-terminal domain [Musa troglodytarum]|uniref:Cyclin, C-terminal domain n=1 Tax=Musa troglodytarum TaxID=320322 RepID=A0A9E7GV26_9LILI|nr:Cyclin, C-terminal domain [Musa troglodytarum]
MKPDAISRERKAKKTRAKPSSLLLLLLVRGLLLVFSFGARSLSVKARRELTDGSKACGTSSSSSSSSSRPDPLANPMPSRRFSARLLAKARLAVLVERPEVAADYIVKEKKNGRESGSLRNDSPDDKGNSMIDSRKKTGTPALASALTVQNKDDGVHSIDELEVLAVVDYVDNIYDFYRHAEYLSKEKVSGTELPLVGINALLIASKYEESGPQKNIDYGDILRHAYTKEQMLAKERDIMKTLKWKLSVPTQFVFLVCFLKAAMCDKELEHMVFFLAELGLMHYSMITYWPSVAAASAVYAARSTLKRTPLWTQTLMHHTGYLEHQLRKCARQLVIFHPSAAERPSKGSLRPLSAIVRRNLKDQRRLLPFPVRYRTQQESIKPPSPYHARTQSSSPPPTLVLLLLGVPPRELITLEKSPVLADDEALEREKTERSRKPLFCFSYYSCGGKKRADRWRRVIRMQRLLCSCSSSRLVLLLLLLNQSSKRKLLSEDVVEKKKRKKEKTKYRPKHRASIAPQVAFDSPPRFLVMEIVQEQNRASKYDCCFIRFFPLLLHCEPSF